MHMAGFFPLWIWCFLDIKHSGAREHEMLTGKSQTPVLSFAKALDQAKIPMIVRHVAVPGWTDTKEEARKLGELLKKYRNIQEIEVLPYPYHGRGQIPETGHFLPAGGGAAHEKDSSRNSPE